MKKKSQLYSIITEVICGISFMASCIAYYKSGKVSLAILLLSAGIINAGCAGFNIYIYRRVNKEKNRNS